MKKLSIFALIAAGLIMSGPTTRVARAETIDEQNAAMYNLGMFAEEWDLSWYAGRDTVGAPWTVELQQPGKKDRPRIIWRESNYKNLSTAVALVESDFVKYPDGSSFNGDGGK